MIVQINKITILLIVFTFLLSCNNMNTEYRKTVDLVITNNSGKTVDKILIKDESVKDWSDNLISTPLGDKASVTIKDLNKSSYSIRFYGDNDNLLAEHNEDLTEYEIFNLTITMGDIND